VTDIYVALCHSLMHGGDRCARVHSGVHSLRWLSRLCSTKCVHMLHAALVHFKSAVYIVLAECVAVQLTSRCSTWAGWLLARSDAKETRTAIFLCVITCHGVGQGWFVSFFPSVFQGWPGVVSTAEPGNLPPYSKLAECSLTCCQQSASLVGVGTDSVSMQGLQSLPAAAAAAAAAAAVPFYRPRWGLLVVCVQETQNSIRCLALCQSPGRLEPPAASPVQVPGC